MKKSKTNIWVYFLMISLLAVSYLFFTATISNVFAQEMASLDETTATVSVTASGETNYYASFSDALSNLPKKSTITILKDTSFPATRGLNCSIDLNGNTLSGGGTKNYNCTLTILDSKGTGTLSGSITFYSSNISVKSAGVIERIMLTDRSVATISGGKINYINANVNSLNIAGGEINNLCIQNVASIHLSGGTINNFTFVSIDVNFAMLNEGYIYANPTDNSPIKISNMTPATKASIIKCPHPAFTDYVCDYCDYICEHSGHFNKDGICEVCGYVCSHLEVNEHDVCLNCNLQMEAKVQSSSTNKNFLKLEDAITSLQNDDALIICKNVTIENSVNINAICTIDLCGYSLDGFYINLDNKISVIDSKGNGFIAISAYSTSSQIELKGAETTNFIITANAGKIKFYSGIIIRISIDNGTIENALPDGYIFVKHDKAGATKMTKQETSVSSFYEDNRYLTCQICEHESIAKDLKCKYCGATLTQEQILQALAQDLDNTKQELAQAIAKKEDIASINEKVRTLNETISSAETTCKAYADNKDTQLKSDLENQINIAKQDAMNYSNSALETAKTSLTSAISEKLNIDEYNQKVQELTMAIINAQTASEAYADDKDSELKVELINNINESKSALQSTNNEILERLAKAESNIDSKTNDINSLKTALIVLSVLFATVLSAGFITMYLLIKRKK